VISTLKLGSGYVIPMKQKELQVIFYSGTSRQDVFPAKILAVDEKYDLAILKVEKSKCEHLTLGDSSGLQETTPIWILGFPFGKLLSVLQRGPEISINRGYITSLRHDERGSLQRIQFDAVVNRGNSGGPLLLPDGRVMGIANIALGPTGVNFAVPVSFLKKLMKECPFDMKTGKECRIIVNSEPVGAKVYFNSKFIGKAPLTAKTEGGLKELMISAPGYCQWGKNISFYDGKKIEVKLKPIKTDILKVVSVDKKGKAEYGMPMKRGKKIFTESFTDEMSIKTWKQDTGGGEERSWYVEKGILHQFEANGLLHAIFVGDEKRKDFSLSSRVKIKTNEANGRAGLIFHSTDDGFALFRLFRKTSNVQLAYHSNNPFGWQVLAERSLPFKVEGDKWYGMEVQVSGKQIVCLIDDKVVLEATTDGMHSGGMGFYSVDSKASFDDVVVTEIERGRKKEADKVSLKSFWFSERFSEISGFWQPFKDLKPDDPWITTQRGCIQLDNTSGPYMNIMNRYDIYDFELYCLVSVNSGIVGVVFRHDEKQRYIFTINPEKQTASILLEKDGARKELIKKDKNFQDIKRTKESNLYPLLITIRAKGDKIQITVNKDVLFNITDDTLKNGMIGFYTDKAKAIFHTLVISSPKKQKKTE
jgi:hypothetical protein